MKKNLAVFCSAIIVLTASAEIFAQTRGANYNPPSRSGSSSASSSSSSSNSTPRGANYNPPTRSNSSASVGTPRPNSSSSSTPRGSNYNPPSSSSGSSSSSSSYTPPRPTPSQPTHTSPSGVPRGPRYNPNPSSNTTYYPAPHVPRQIEYRTIRYHSYRDYALYVNHRYIYRNWIQEPVLYSYSNGYWMMDNYPYYVHRGFRYRYHPVEQCRYQLVDSTNYTSVTNYSVRACTIAYDQCAYDRDNMNRNLYTDRYFCAENVDYDLASSNDYDWNPYANDMNNSQEYAIENYLAGKSFLEIFYDAQRYGVGSCSIQSLPSYYNSYANEYAVRVGSSSYPEMDGSVTSSSANRIGCYERSAEENAGCIMKAAIQQGYCL